MTAFAAGLYVTYTRVVYQTYTWLYDEFFSKQFFIFQCLKSHVARKRHTQSYIIIYYIGSGPMRSIILSFRRIAQWLVHLRVYIYNIYYIHIIFLYTFFYALGYTYIGVRVTNYSGDAPEDAAGKQIFDRASRTRLGLYIITLSSYANRRRRRRFETGNNIVIPLRTLYTVISLSTFTPFLCLKNII